MVQRPDSLLSRIAPSLTGGVRSSPSLPQSPPPNRHTTWWPGLVTRRYNYVKKWQKEGARRRDAGNDPGGGTAPLGPNHNTAPKG